MLYENLIKASLKNGINIHWIIVLGQLTHLIKHSSNLWIASQKVFTLLSENLGHKNVKHMK